MMTLPLIGAKLSLCLPKQKNYGFFLSLCLIFVHLTALSATEFSINNPAAEFEELTTEEVHTLSLIHI